MTDDDLSNIGGATYTALMSKASPTTLRERNRIRARGEIMDVTLQIVDADGIAACRIDEIARRVGASKTTVYAHFRGGLDQILQEMYRDLSNAVIEGAVQRRAGCQDFAERVVSMADSLFEICAKPRLGRFYMMLTPALSPMLEQVVGAGSSFFLQMIISDLVALGVPAEQAEERAVVIVGAMRECATAIARDPTRRQRFHPVLRRLAEGMLDGADG